MQSQAKSSRGQSARLRAILLTGAMSTCAMLAMPAQAQDELQQSEAESSEAIIITGSRIARRDYQANSPIVTVGSELLESSASSAIETSLNKLPQFTPAQTPALGGDIQPTATNTPGAASVSLRGLGANRNIVLLDGRRATPGNANMVVDINSIPSAAIERVEIITGGASATYGADAVGGVVNFILKKNVRGLELDARMGISQRGDGQEYTISGIMGTDFADDRGNISLSFETNERKSALRRDRPWFMNLYLDPNITGIQNFSDFPAYVTGAQIQPSQAALNAVFAGRDTAAFPNYPRNTTLWVNTNGTVFGGINNFASRAGTYRYTGPFDAEIKKTSLGFLGENFLEDQLVLPLTRFNIYARGNYEITDWINLVAQGYFNKANTKTVQQRAVAGNGWSANIPIANHPVPAELATLLASRTIAANVSAKTLADLNCPTAVPGGSGAACDWQLNLYPLPSNRTVDADVYTYQMLVALEGKVPGTDWTWDIAGSHGESSTNFIASGFASLERYRAVVRSPNWGAGFSAQGNAIQGGFGASRATCTSGLNPFDAIPTSQDCIDAIAADIKSRSVMQQTSWEANAQGSLFQLPAGDLRGAVGANYRRNRFNYTNDTLTTQGVSFLDQAAGLYPSGNSRGSITVKELYGELLIPVLKDLPLIKRWELEVGVRTSDYSTTGNSFTWKVLGDWQVTDWLRLRGGYNKAERAPNIAELFQAPQQGFVNVNRGDACSSTNNVLSYSAGPANTRNRAAIRTLCETLMNAIDPSTAQTFYANTQVAGTTTGFVTSSGNINVKPEQAKTWTFGAVLRAPSGSPWLRGLSVAVDYYNVKIEDAIGAETGELIQQKCFDTAFNPTLDPNSVGCRNVVRNVGIGTIGNLVGLYQNFGRIKTAGIDAQIDWNLDLDDTVGLPGRFGFSSVINYLIKLKSSDYPTNALAEYAGTLGTAQNGLNAGGAYRWKLFNTYSYSLDGFRIALQWLHLPHTAATAYATDKNTVTRGAPAYDLFHLNSSYAVTPNASISFGIDNLFDKAPPLHTYNAFPNAANGELRGGTLGAASSTGTGQMYDLNGRRFYVGAHFKF